MNAMMLQRKRFFSGDSSSSDGLPLSTSTSALNDHHPQRCSTPPQSGNMPLIAGDEDGGYYAIDVSRAVPGRASSTSIVRHRSALSLSPSSKKAPPRKAVSMLFTSTSSSSTNNNPTTSSNSSCSSSASSVDSGCGGGTGSGSLSDAYAPSYPLQLPIYGHHHGPRSSSPLGRRRPSGYGLGNHSNHWNHNNWVCAIVSVMGLVVMAVLAASSYQHNASLTMELVYRETEVEMHLDHSRNLEAKVNEMRSETIHLHKRIEELEDEMSQPTQQELNIQRKVFHLEHTQQEVQRGIQETAKRMLREFYGPGPKYQVEMKLAFDPQSNIVQDASTEIDTTILLETASIDDMPHTVFVFLEQVRHGIFDQTAFFRNTPHVVEAGVGHDHAKLVALERSEPSLSHVLFPEHGNDKEFHHQQYTLGFTSSGPDFYVNMQDNSERSKLLEEKKTRASDIAQADPCFARIVRGFNTMERIHRADVREEELSFRRKQHRMVHPVMIESMKVLGKDAVKAESRRR